MASGFAAACGGSSSSSPLAGTWEANIAAPGMNVDPIRIEFRDDGTYTTTRSTCTESGKWKSFGSAGSLSLTTTPTASTCGSTLNTDTTVLYSLSADKNTLVVMSSGFGSPAVSLVLQRGSTGAFPSRPQSPAGVTATVSNASTFEVTVSWTAASSASAYNVIWTATYTGSQPHTVGVVTGTSVAIAIAEASGVTNWQAQTNFTVTAIGAGGSSAPSSAVHP